MRFKENSLVMCKRCSVSKPWNRETFTWCKKQGMMQPCKECSRKRKQEYDGSEHGKQVTARYLATPEFKIWKRQYYRAHPEMGVRGTHRRRVRKLNLESSFTDNDWGHCLSYWDNKCAICRKNASAEYIIAREHWIPVVKGGGYTKQNIIPMCHSVKGGTNGCNNTKSARDPLTWLVDKLGLESAEQKLVQIEAYFAWIVTQVDNK
jgi:hypothetical protein